MQLAEVLSKLNDGEDLTDAEKKFLAEYKEPDVDAAVKKAVAETGYKERQEAKKAKAEADSLKEQLAELQEQVEEMEGSKGTDLEKLQRTLDKANKKLEKAEAKAQELEQQNTRIHRDYAFSTVLGSVNFVDDQGREAGSLLLKERLKDVDDLTEADAVKPVVEQFVQDFPRLIRADDAAGTGQPAQNGGGAAQKPSKGLTAEDIKKMPADEFNKLRAEGKLFTAAAQPPA